MSTPSVEDDLQAALYAAMYGDLELNVLVGGTSYFGQGGYVAGRFYDHVPQRSSPGADGYPFVALSVGDSDEHGDKDAENGYLVRATFRLFSRYEGTTELNAMRACLRRLFHRRIPTAANQRVYLARFSRANTSLGADGHTRQGIDEYNFQTQSLY